MPATLWPRRRGVISHDSALDLWDLCDVNPATIHVTVPKAARVRRAAPPVDEVHVRDLDPADITRFEGIPVVTPAKAILDSRASRVKPDFPPKNKPPTTVSRSSS